jgi:hypothetical protein
MTATQTANQTTEINKINYLNHSIERKLGRAVTERDAAATRIATGALTDSFTIEKLIKAEAELRVWSEIDRFINAHTEADKSEDETLARLIQYIGKYAISEHKINSSSNISVEIETEHRVEFARAYNFIAGIQQASN